MKIAIYSHSIAPSIDGVCRRFTSIIHELVRQGHELILFTLEEKPEDLPPLTDIVMLDYFFMPAYPNKRVAKPSFRNMYVITQTLVKHRPDATHVTADGIAQMFALAGLFANVPIVGSFHTDLLDLVSTHHANFFQKWCITFKEHVDSLVLDSCATTSKSFAVKLASQGLPTEHVIVTGVDSKLFHPSKANKQIRRELMFGEEDGLLCVYVGRISREKRIELLVEALRDVPNAFLAIIGDGPSAPVYSALHGLGNRLYCKPRFLSHAELAEVYASCDIHVSASEFETLGNTVLEAHACGVPVVVPRTQGFRDTVNHGENGYLFEPASSESARSYIVQLQNDASLRKRMGESGRKGVQGRAVDAVVADLVKWYQRGTVPFCMFCIAMYEMVVRLINVVGLSVVQALTAEEAKDLSAHIHVPVNPEVARKGKKNN